MLLLFFVLFTTQIFCSTELQQAQLLAAKLSSDGHPVHLTINAVSNENSQASFVNFFDSSRKLLSTGKEQFSASFSSFCEYIKNNKKTMFFYTCLALITAAQLRLWQLKLKLKMGILWSKSLSEKSIEDLYQIPQRTLGSNLLSDIQKVYMQLDNPTNFVKPLTFFIQDTEREKAILEEYRFIVNSIDKLYLKKLLFYDAALLETIPERLNRLAYLKNSFLNWLAEFKVSHAQEFLQTRSRKSGFVLRGEIAL